MNDSFNPSPQRQSRADFATKVSLALAGIRRGVSEARRFARVQMSVRSRVETGELHPAVVEQDEAFLSTATDIPAETMDPDTFLYGQRPAPSIEMMPFTIEQTLDEADDPHRGLSADGLFGITKITGQLCSSQCAHAQPRRLLRLDEGLELLAVDLTEPMWLRRYNGGLPVWFAFVVSCPSGLVHYELRQGMDANIVRTAIARAFPGHDVRVSGVIVRA